jgi:hypothetical protein
VFFILVGALHVPSGFSAHHQEIKTTWSIGTGYNCVLLPLAWLSSYSTTLAITTHKSDKYRCRIYSFWAPDDERKTRSKHLEHWQQ